MAVRDGVMWNNAGVSCKELELPLIYKVLVLICYTMSKYYCFASPSNVPIWWSNVQKSKTSCLLLLEADNIFATVTFCVNVPFRFSFTCLDCAKAKANGDFVSEWAFRNVVTWHSIWMPLENLCLQASLSSRYLTFHGADFCLFFLLKLCKQKNEPRSINKRRSLPAKSFSHSVHCLEVSNCFKPYTSVT